jgi:putative protease
MRRIIDKAKEAGITAVIASDLAVMNYCRKKGMELHISTQSNITNIETVELYADYADVVVMARELTLKQVGDIVKNIQRNHITGRRVIWYKSKFLPTVLCVWLFLENAI